MKANVNIKTHPSLFQRTSSVWLRHMRVYARNLISNAFPPFLEPLIFLAAMGLGLGKYLLKMDNIPYIQFLAPGLLVTSAMFTAAFECSYGTFIRLEFNKVYDGMLAAPISVNNLLVGEILWAGTKGFFFSFAVLIIITLFGIINSFSSFLAPFIGFLTGIMFAALSLFITSFVKTINYFSFYFTGLLSPMFFFSGVVFPVSNLPKALKIVAETFPLTHSVRIVRAVCLNKPFHYLLWDLSYMIIFSVLIGFIAIKRLKKRLID